MTMTPLNNPADIDPDWLDQLGAIVRNTTPPADPEAGARMLVAIDNLRRDLATHREDIEAIMHTTIGRESTLAIDGLGAFTPSYASTKVTWDNENLARLVVDSWRHDKTTGERIEEAPHEKILRVWTIPPSRKPSTTALAEYGIDKDALDEFRTRENGRRTIKVTPAEAKAMQ